MKYEFKYIKLDDYELKYTNKNGDDITIPFTRNIKMANKLQSIEKRARLNMYKDLTEMGVTKDDLIVKKQENGKTIYDETNYKMYEEQYMNLARLEVINEIYEMCFNKPISDLLIDMGANEVKDVNEVQKFSQEFASIIMGKDNQEFPSK